MKVVILLELKTGDRMSKLILLMAILLAVVLVAALSGGISLYRAEDILQG